MRAQYEHLRGIETTGGALQYGCIRQNLRPAPMGMCA